MSTTTSRCVRGGSSSLTRCGHESQRCLHKQSGGACGGPGWRDGCDGTGSGYARGSPRVLSLSWGVCACRARARVLGDVGAAAGAPWRSLGGLIGGDGVRPPRVEAAVVKIDAAGVKLARGWRSRAVASGKRSAAAVRGEVAQLQPLAASQGCAVTKVETLRMRRERIVGERV